MKIARWLLIAAAIVGALLLARWGIERLLEHWDNSEQALADRQRFNAERDSLLRIVRQNEQRADASDAAALAKEQEADRLRDQRLALQGKLARSEQETDSLARLLAAGDSQGGTWQGLFIRRTAELVTAKQALAKAEDETAKLRGSNADLRSSNSDLRESNRLLHAQGALDSTRIRTLETALARATRRRKILGLLTLPEITAGYGALAQRDSLGTWRIHHGPSAQVGWRIFP